MQLRFVVDVEFPTSNPDALPWSGQLVVHLDVVGGMLAVEGVCLDGGRVSFAEPEAALCFPLSSVVCAPGSAGAGESVVISGMCDAGIDVEFTVLVPRFAQASDLIHLLEEGGATTVHRRPGARKEDLRPAPINVSTPESNYTRAASRDTARADIAAGVPLSDTLPPALSSAPPPPAPQLPGPGAERRCAAQVSPREHHEQRRARRARHARGGLPPGR
jgi:hypothetical protein